MMGFPMDKENEYVSVSVRKIENGYIKTTSKSEGGSYTSSEEFCEAKPSMEPVPQPARRGSSLRDAVRSLK